MSVRTYKVVVFVPAFYPIEAKDEAEALELFLFVRPEILFFAEKLTEKIRQLVQILEYRRFDNDFAHGAPRYSINAMVWQCGLPSFLLLILILLLILREDMRSPQGYDQDQDQEQELTEAMMPVR